VNKTRTNFREPGLALETALARIQWTRVDNRDPVKTYNKTAIADLPKLMPARPRWQLLME